MMADRDSEQADMMISDMAVSDTASDYTIAERRTEREYCWLAAPYNSSK